jgi:hypothetical protein
MKEVSEREFGFEDTWWMEMAQNMLSGRFGISCIKPFGFAATICSFIS